MLLINDQPINFFKFSGGEIQVRLSEVLVAERATLTWKPTCSDDILLLLLAVNALQKEGMYDIQLDCLYLPYARQDRVCFPGEAFSLEMICELLDGLNLSAINFWDLHNESETFKFFSNTSVVNAEPKDIFARYKILHDFEIDNLVLCAPDSGASYRVELMCEQFGMLRPISLHKVRDPHSGHITELKYASYNNSLYDRDVMVVDDICDGGATFVKTAKILREQTNGNLFLYVTHGIFSKGLDELLTHFQHIYCHHVLDGTKYKSSDRLTILRSFLHD